MTDPYRNLWDETWHTVFDKQSVDGDPLELELLHGTVSTLNAWLLHLGFQVAVDAVHNVNTGQIVVHARPTDEFVDNASLRIARETYFTHKRVHRRRLAQRTNEGTKP